MRVENTEWTLMGWGTGQNEPVDILVGQKGSEFFGFGIRHERLEIVSNLQESDNVRRMLYDSEGIPLSQKVWDDDSRGTLAIGSHRDQ